eukprot:CAMPEP_0194545398 /NCGR_PEP_ID=MMETSP0253-20130528/89120_1 /TAXON_ID=2966 /ORGANISM="Noctiluca scintillans" /LENGTH=32 /DNA_ID= /DNA_START= /DNA_END= /DNA_ORIENTATION=
MERPLKRARHVKHGAGLTLDEEHEEWADPNAG